VSHVYKVLGYVVPLPGLSLYRIAILKEKVMAERKLRGHRDSPESPVEQGTNEALALAAAQWQQTFDAIDDFVMLIDTDYVILQANRAVRDAFPDAKFPGARCCELIHGAAGPPAGCPSSSVFRTGKSARVELQEPHLGDQWFDASTCPIKDETGAVVQVVHVIRNITERKQAEEELLLKTALLEAQAEASIDGVLAVDEEGRSILFNRRFGQMWQIPREVLETRDDARMLQYVRDQLKDPDGFLATVEYLYARPEEKSRDEIQLKDGRVFDRYSSPLVDTHHRHHGRIWYFRDITDRKRAEEERIALEAKVRQAQKLESMGVLAGGIAHDFNNLLTGVIGNAELALMDLPAGSPARHSIEEINAAARRAAELAGQMLAYSGKGQFVLEAIDLSRLVRKLQRLLGSAVSKRVTLEFDLADGLPAVEGDATQLRQVVMNLVINASEAIGDGDGVVTVRTWLTDADTSYLADSHVDDGLPSGPYVCLEVSDTGCGMDEETKAKLFDPFFSTKFTGRGLGLAAVLGIVRGHGGAIRVQSKPGKGSTFRVLLPICDASAPELPEPDEVPEGGLRGHGTVLVVDDEEVVRQVGKSALARLGFTVLTAEDGPQAIEAVRADPEGVQAVLLDLTMPHMDAEGVVRELRRLRKDLPIILSSGYSEDEAVRRFAAEDLAGFIQKPYDPATLIQTLQRIMRGRPAH